MKLKHLLLCLLIVCSATISTAQNELRVVYNDDLELFIGQLEVSQKITIRQLLEHVGEPNKKVEHPNGEVSYFYENAGVVFFTSGRHVKGMGINYNWDGDNKFPEKSFTGSLLLGELEITKETTSADISRIESIPFTCPIPLLCGITDRTAPIQCSVAFDDGILTQVVFLFR